MNKLILILMMSSVGQAATLSWNEEALKQIENAPTLRELSCSAKSIAGSELCELFKKDHGVKNKIQIQRLNESTISIQSGSKSVKVERTNNRMQFLLNDRLIDLSKYPNQERLGFAVDAILSAKTSAQWSLIKRAWADNNWDPKVKAPVLGLFAIQMVYDTCPLKVKKKDAFLEFVESCEANSDAVYAYLKDKGIEARGKSKKADRNKIDAEIDQINKAMARVTGDIDAKYANARTCDCEDDKTQVSCKLERFAERDPKNLTAPREQGMDKCRRMLLEIAMAPTSGDAETKEKAKRLLDNIDAKLLGIKSEPPIKGLTPAGASK